MNLDRVIARLRDLVNVCRDGEVVFRDAALAAVDNHLRTLFYNYSRQRGQLAAELYQELRRLGSDCRAAESWARGRRWPGGGAPSTLERDDPAILADCLHEVSTALEAYEQALIEVNQPASAQQIVHRQHAAIQAARERLEELAAERAAQVRPAAALAAQ